MKKILTVIIISIIALTLMSCNNNPNSDFCDETRVDGVYKCSTEFYAFNTIITSTFMIDKDTKFDFEDVFEGIKEIIYEYDKLLDQYNEYEGITNIYTINQSSDALVVDVKLFDAVEYALKHQDVAPESQDLLFNIALQPVLRIWHDARDNEACVEGLFYNTCPIPSEDSLNQDFNIDPSDIELNRDNLTIAFKKPNMGIDLGGFAKGYVSMIIEDYLEEYNANYILNLGSSNILVGGKNISNPDGDYYSIGLTTPSYNPFNNAPYGATKIEARYSVVTSGSYQQYFKNIDETDDLYYHHIIDPRTNYPGGQALAVSIITKETGISDILSTAIFLMDYEEGLAYVNAYPDLEAIWYFSEDDIRMSENFDSFFILL